MANNDAAGIMIKQINDALSKIANNDLRESDLTISQVGMLSTLYHAENQDMTLKELEKAHHVSQPTVFGIVRRLSEKGLVITFDDEVNQRIKHVRLTEEGIRQAEIGESHMADTEALLMKNLSEEERIQLKIVLKKILSGLM